MKLILQITKIVVIAAALLFVGLIICPLAPGKGRVDASQVLLRAQAVQAKTKSNLAELPKNTTGLKPLVEGEDSIAGRDAWVMRLKPDAKHVPWSQYWIDKKTFEVVAYRHWDGKNRMVTSEKL